MKKQQTGGVRAIAVAALGGFVAGAVTVSLLRWNGPVLTESTSARSANDDCGGATYERTPGEPAARGEKRASASVPAPAPAPVDRIDIDPKADLKERDLLIPVAGVKPEALHTSFSEKRGAARAHEAIDILAPRHTRVLAVEDGTIARLFYSKAGGITIYQFDPTSTYTYYYAHLESYAEGLREGDRIRRGQVLGYVGTSGNAPEDTPHLHFAIFRLGDKKQWWQGTPIDPFEVLK